MVAQYFPLGAFASFKLFWAFPLIGVHHLLKLRQIRRGFFLIAAPALAVLQLFLATGTSRLMGLSFPAVLVGAGVVREKWGSARLASVLWGLIGLNFLVPQYYIGQASAYPLYPLPLSLILKYLFGIDAWHLWWG